VTAENVHSKPWHIREKYYLERERKRVNAGATEAMKIRNRIIDEIQRTLDEKAEEIKRDDRIRKPILDYLKLLYINGEL